MNRQTTGKLGEELAAKYLARNGYQIVTRNFQTRFGEIDIVAKEKNTLVFVEVRTKGDNRFGKPEESITENKKFKLRRMAEYFLLTKDIKMENCRVDFIGISLLEGSAKLRHHKNIEV